METSNLVAKLVDKISYLEQKAHSVIIESSSIAIETQSKELDKLGPLLPTVQAEIGNIQKNKTVSAKGFSWKYADLNTILMTAFPIINSHGIYLYFEVILWNDKKILRTKLFHGDSCQWIGTLATLPQDGTSSQEYGKAETYQKRYSVKNLLGITISDDAYDDDGETERKNTANQDQTLAEPSIISQIQLSKLIDLTEHDEEARKTICDTLKISDISYIKESDFASVLNFIKKRMETK